MNPKLHINMKEMIEQQEKALLDGEDQIVSGIKYIWHTIKTTILQILKYVLNRLQKNLNKENYILKNKVKARILTCVSLDHYWS